MESAGAALAQTSARWLRVCRLQQARFRLLVADAAAAASTCTSTSAATVGQLLIKVGLVSVDDMRAFVLAALSRWLGVDKTNDS